MKRSLRYQAGTVQILRQVFLLFSLVLSLATVSAQHSLAASQSAVKAVKLAVDNKPDAAAQLARQSGDPVARKIVEWQYLRNNRKSVGYRRLMDFITANDDWPLLRRLETAAEIELLRSESPLDLIAEHFPKRTPVSTRGWMARARYALGKGDKATARKRLLEAWYNPDLDEAGERLALRMFKPIFRRSDHEGRLWRLIVAQKTRAALRFAKRISKQHVAAAKVARHLIRVNKNADTKLRKLPASLRNSVAMRYALSRYYRKRGKQMQAMKILLNLPANPARHLNQEQWWIEKRLIVRNLMGPAHRKHWPNLYRLAKSHGFASGKHHDEGEFLAGFIALRKLNQPKTALPHFQRMAGKARNRTERSRAYYWMARTYMALGDAGAADQAFRKGAASPTLYYGQLSREALGQGKEPITIRRSAVTAAARKSVRKHELVRAYLLLSEAGAEYTAAAFVWPMANAFKTGAELSAVAEIVKKESGITASVRFAKAAGSRGIDIDDWAYPLGALPDWRRIGKPVEKAMVYGLSRQESEFHPGAQSGAGARGLMQLMPGTAKIIARQYRMRYSKSKLTSDPVYNVTLGAAHLGDLIADFGGSYVLTLVGYNAGPRRATDWIKAYGDLRHASVDAVDWVEHIPFTETRKYVQKVLQNVHVYRSRLSPRKAVGMSTDLKRGGSGSLSGTTSAENCSGKSRSLTDLIDKC